VPQDACQIQTGGLHETLVSLRTPEPSVDVDDPSLIERVEVAYEHRPIALPYYEDAVWNRILDGYARSGAAGGFLFPCAALSCLSRLRALAGGRMLLLCGDRGSHCADDVCGRDPGLATHGSFSLPVNFHAISEW